MEIEKLIHLRPYLYHLTSKENAQKIIESKRLYSANELIRRSGEKKNKVFGRTRRTGSTPIIIGEETYYLRDQRPISEVNLAKCLTDNWSISDFLYHLNDRVFMWPTIGRLTSHYKTYEKEKPVIFRFSTADILAANPHAKFCRLNSGATRSNSYLDGAPPERGAKSFLSAAECGLRPSQVVEVTFEKQCLIVGSFDKGIKPEGPFKTVWDN